MVDEMIDGNTGYSEAQAMKELRMLDKQIDRLFKKLDGLSNRRTFLQGIVSGSKKYETHMRKHYPNG